MSVIAVEPEPHLRGLAHAAAREAPVPVEVQAGTAERLSLGDASCDVAVASLVLCSVSDQAEVLAEMRRVLRPGGELRFYEHVLSAQPFPFSMSPLQPAVPFIVGIARRT